jgi:hypothetical protein
MLSSVSNAHERLYNDFIRQYVRRAYSWPVLDRTGEVSCPTKSFEGASSIEAWRDIIYGFGALKIALLYRLCKLGSSSCTLLRGTRLSELRR